MARAGKILKDWLLAWHRLAAVWEVSPMGLHGRGEHAWSNPQRLSRKELWNKDFHPRIIIPCHPPRPLDGEATPALKGSTIGHQVQMTSSLKASSAQPIIGPLPIARARSEIIAISMSYLILCSIHCFIHVTVIVFSSKLHVQYTCFDPAMFRLFMRWWLYSLG